MSQRQHKNLLRFLTNAAYNSKLQTKNNINGFFKCIDKQCKICKKIFNECSFFTCSNGIDWEIFSRITCSTVYVLHYLKRNMCKLETYIGKLIGNAKLGF